MLVPWTYITDQLGSISFSRGLLLAGRCHFVIFLSDQRDISARTGSNFNHTKSDEISQIQYFLSLFEVLLSHRQLNLATSIFLGRTSCTIWWKVILESSSIVGSLRQFSRMTGFLRSTYWWVNFSWEIEQLSRAICWGIFLPARFKDCSSPRKGQQVSMLIWPESK